MSYKELAQQIELNTGSLGVSAHIAAHHTEEDCFEQVCKYQQNDFYVRNLFVIPRQPYSISVSEQTHFLD